MIALLQGNFSDAEAFADRALEQAGSEADVIANAAMVLSHCGRPIDERLGKMPLSSTMPRASVSLRFSSAWQSGYLDFLSLLGSGF